MAIEKDAEQALQNPEAAMRCILMHIPQLTELVANLLVVAKHSDKQLCATCHDLLPNREFQHYRDKPMTTCKACKNRYDREYRAKALRA